MRVEVHDEELRALCVVAGVAVVNNTIDGCYHMEHPRQSRYYKIIPYHAQREEWETAIREFLEDLDRPA